MWYMKPPKIFYLYKAINKTNQKAYIGYTANLKTRIRAHKNEANRGSLLVFHQAIRKYGIDNFDFVIICTSWNELDVLNYIEPSLIIQHNTYYGNGQGYNMSLNYVGEYERQVNKQRKRRPWTDEEKRIASERAKITNNTPEVRSAISNGLKEYYANGGKHPGDPIKQGKMLSELNKKRWQDPVYREKMIKHLSNPSDESRKKRSEIQKGKPKKGGWKHSEETKLKIGESNKNKIYSEETKKTMSEARTKYFEDPVNRLNMSEKAKLRPPNPELMEKLKQINTKSYKCIDPTGIEEIVNNIKDYCDLDGLNVVTARSSALNNRLTKTGYRFIRLN